LLRIDAILSLYRIIVEEGAVYGAAIRTIIVFVCYSRENCGIIAKNCVSDQEIIGCVISKGKYCRCKVLYYASIDDTFSVGVGKINCTAAIQNYPLKTISAAIINPVIVPMATAKPHNREAVRVIFITHEMNYTIDIHRPGFIVSIDI